MPALVAAHYEAGFVANALMIAALVPPAFALVAYIYWTFKDPNRLQSEDFVLQQRWMDTNAQIGDNRTKEVIDVAPEHSRLAANTAALAGD